MWQCREQAQFSVLYCATLVLGYSFVFSFELSSCDCGPLSVDPITRALAVLPCAQHLCSVVLEHCQCWLPGVSCQGRQTHPPAVGRLCWPELCPRAGPCVCKVTHCCYTLSPWIRHSCYREKEAQLPPGSRAAESDVLSINVISN